MSDEQNKETGLAKLNPDWNDIWVMMQELGRAIAPLLDTASPPSWAISLQFVMEVAAPDIADKCAVNGDWASSGANSGHD